MTRVLIALLPLVACNPGRHQIFISLVETGGPGSIGNPGFGTESLGDRSGVTAILDEQEFTFEGLTAYEDGTVTAYDTDPDDPSVHTLERRWLIRGIAFGVGYQPCGSAGPGISLTLGSEIVEASECTIFVTLINDAAIEGRFDAYFAPESPEFPSGDVQQGYFRMRP